MRVTTKVPTVDPDQGWPGPPQGSPAGAGREAEEEPRPTSPGAASGGPTGGGDASVLGPPESAPPGGGADQAGDEVQADLDALTAAEQQRDEYLELAKRTQADFENYRRRMAAETRLRRCGEGLSWRLRLVER